MMLGVLDSVFLQPLMLIYGALFGFFSGFEVGTALVLFAVTLNLLLLPVYNQMEQRARGLRTVKGQVERDVARMKRHFSGRERYFYIRAVYRQYRYHPISHLLGSADLFIQILVFATVYRFLSALPVLQGAAFGPIVDLSRPDGLLFGVNLLPLLMTAINAASVYFYIDDRGKRTQGWALAAIFLVLLYGSGSGLVLYWTTNNLFSLVRNVLTRRIPTPSWLKRSIEQLSVQR